MIPKDVVDWLSPLLGLVGSLMLAFPYFVDVKARIRREKKISEVDNGSYSEEDAAKLREAIKRARTEEVLEPDKRMAILAGVGCLLLVLSFLVLLFAAPEVAVRHGG
jgi:hypothetical protein